MSQKLSAEELARAFADQRRFLVSLSKLYDDGDPAIAVLLAVTVETLCHDAGKKYQSVLRQLGVKGKLKFVSSGEVDPRNLLRSAPLTFTRISTQTGAQYLPRLGEMGWGAHKETSFEKWWEGIVLSDPPNYRMSRKNITSRLRNSAGGGHLDEVLRDPNYERFARPQTTTLFQLRKGEAPRPVMGEHLATMRQIAWELTKTMEQLDG
jgi:hypothetical protein